MRARAPVYLLVVLVASTLAAAQSQTPPAPGYLTPPKVVVDILDTPPLPQAVVSPTRQSIALLHRKSMPNLAELARPMLRLAGTRVNPKTNGPHRTSGIVGISLKDLTGAAERTVVTPPNAELGSVSFSPDGRRLAFTATRDNGIELWVADATTGQAKAVTGPTLNAAAGDPCEWLRDGAALLCRLVPAARGPAPAVPAVPTAPNIQENAGKAAPVRTYEDLLQSAHDEDLFEYYFTAQLAVVNAAGGTPTAIGKAALIERAEASPNAEFVVVSRLKRPFSRLVPYEDFTKEVEIWNRRGEAVRRIADLPLADTVPIGGVPVGPRAYRWKPTDPSTIVWVEALDEGDPRKSVPHRDRVVALEPPFAGTPVEIITTEYRFQNVSWTDEGTTIVSESDRQRRWRRSWLLDPGGGAPRKLVDMSAEDRYKDPGDPVARPRGTADGGFGPGGGRAAGVVLQQGNAVYLTGAGASPQGDRPFLDRLNLRTLSTERLFRSDEKSYETVVAILADDGSSILTRAESPVDPPNYFVRDLRAGSRRAITDFRNPVPQLTGIHRQFLTYDRKDGVKLSATLYLPPGYKAGERLPVVMWAYPREFTDPDAAGQVSGSPNRFLLPRGPSHLLLLTQGYAILDDPTMPIVGAGETANDTYVDQLVASAEAAVNTVVELGVGDRDRMGVGGHSYGAFMTANLLAHSDLFRAGIARSGAYNRSLTPFGFQNERRTFWEVPDIYARMSPFWYAHKVNEPILLIHGEADDNSGTFPIQSERFYMALKGHGATVRYVTLPHEAHGYAGRESVLHTVAEMLNWCERWVKSARPRTTTTASGR